MDGVDRGPSPPLFPSAPLSPPPRYLAWPVTAAQSSLPVWASKAMHTSDKVPSTSRATTVNALPSATTIELNPAGVLAVHRRLGPSEVQGSGEASVDDPLPKLPRYCAQFSAAQNEPAANQVPSQPRH